jgi:hypothetical protein
MISVCVFGSVARRRPDKLSDRDVLVVAPTMTEAETEAQPWRKTGWSVSPFARHQMTSMSERRSLFIQHLKQEGIILKDAGLFLKSLFDEFRPKSDYVSEMQDSIWLLRYIQAQRTAGWTSLCGADIAYVSARNIGISLLAGRGIYEFSLSDVLSRLNDCRLISDEHVRALADLRELKFRYRKRLATPDSELVFRQGLQAALVLAEIAPTGKSWLSEPSLQDGYRWLRWLEFNLVSKHDPRDLDALPPSDGLNSVWQLIRDPRNYPDRPRKYDAGWMCASREAARLMLGANSFQKPG